MSFRTKLLSSASAVLLIGAASGAAFAADSTQNAWVIEMMDPGHTTMDQTVDGAQGRGARDDGSRRVNTIRGDYSNNALGISHDQQNNGNNNAIGVASNVLVSTADDNDDDITQNLWINGVSRNGTYSDIPLLDRSDTAVRTNRVTNAYQDVKGVFDVQQNNGDGNVMGIGDVVSANLGAEPFDQSGQGHDDSIQKVRVSGTVDNNQSTDTNKPFFNLRLEPITGERTNTINGAAFQNFLGLASVQQNNGNGNVIQVGTAVIADIGTPNVIDADGSDETASLWVKADGTVQDSTANSSSGLGPSLEPADRDNLITNAFRGDGGDGVKGIVNAQQNNGDNNSMNVANAVRAGYEVADDIDAVGGVNVWTIGESSGNRAFDDHQNRNNLVSGRSFENATGMFTVQQNNGDNNAMNSATGVVASIETGFPRADNAMAGAAAQATVANNFSEVDFASDRRNRLNGSVFNGALGIATVQQNNGDNNVINASKAIIATVGSDADGQDFAGFNGDIMADTLLTATVTGNTSIIHLTALPPGYENELTNSFQGFQGIKTVQQNNGNNNAIQSSVTVVGNVNTGGGS